MAQQSTDRFLEAFETIVRELVDKPDALSIRAAASNDGSIRIQVKAPSKEQGRLIGVQGRTARALRVILVAAGTARGVRYTLDIQGTESTVPMEGARKEPRY